MAEVVTLHGDAVKEPANSWVVEELEDMLRRAKEGEIRGVVFGVVLASNTIVTGWAGAPGTRWPLGAAALLAQHRYAQRLLEDGGSAA